MALKMWKMWSNGIKTTFFPKNYEKSSSGWKNRPGASLPDPHSLGRLEAPPQIPVCDTFELQYTSLLQHVSQFTHFN